MSQPKRSNRLVLSGIASPLRWVAVLAASLMWGCSPASPSTQHQTVKPPLSAEDQALKFKFRGMSGGDRRVDALTKMQGVTLYNEKGQVIESGSFGPKQNSVSSYGSEFGVPKTIRAVWRTGDGIVNEGDGGYSGGTIAGDYTVPVASRIPDELLESLRKEGGLFRLKIRLADNDVLIGWDIERKISQQELKKVQDSRLNGVLQYYASPYHMAGGDFREAQIYNGLVVRKGWYIDKKTGQRIETDF